GQARQAPDRAPSRSRPYRRRARGLTHGAFLSSELREAAAFGGWPATGATRLRSVTPLFIPPAREATGSRRAARRARGGRARSAPRGYPRRARGSVASVGPPPRRARPAPARRRG